MSEMRSDSLDALYAQAVRLHKAGHFGDAIILYNRVLALAPSRVEAHYNLANAFASQGKFTESVAAIRRSIALKPDGADLYVSLGYMLTVLAKIEEAVAAYRQALAIQPDLADAHFQIGSVLSENGHVAEGFEHYIHRARLVFGAGQPRPPAGPDPEHRIKHDFEQREYLCRSGVAAGQVSDMFRLEDGSRLAGPAINRANVTRELLEQWRTNRPQFVVIENFLMPEALEKLRRYCAGSTIWRRNYSAGYIGATPEDGLACPLLAQIAEEISGTYHDILAAHRFRYLGAFKYDSKLSTGTNTHADNSAVNVNFYIAPDEANLDPESGGMDIWDIAMPPNIDMRKYNGDEAAAKDFLTRSNARKFIVPHRSNRAVIFKSDLFHRTSECHFKEGYLNMRINVSLLFGDRGAPTQSSNEAEFPSRPAFYAK
jgi:Tfp pilus assembly protein PilF